MSDKRKRIAILGGGCAGVTAAFYLSATEQLRRGYEVTVYQEGWRLGGKAASGRNPTIGYRIEEHGLHMWLGWYFNAFKLARDVFEEWRPASPVLRDSCDEVFEPIYEAALWDQAEHPWHICLPPKPGKPWDRRRDAKESDYPKEIIDWLSSGQATRAAFNGLFSPAATGKRMFRTANIAAAIVRGLIRDVLVEGRLDFSRIDDYDLRDWLVKHGVAASDVEDDPLTRAFYDVAFAYPEGKTRGSVAAGAGLKTILRTIFGYRGAPLWRLRGSMGDLLFAPLYEVLRKRGVRFEFFHRVNSVHASSDGFRVERILLSRQARCRGNYAPLEWLHGVPVWPNQPLWDQLEIKAGVGTDDVNFESISCNHCVDERVLLHGPDFDCAILAIPGPALKGITHDLCSRDPKWRSMISHTHSVATKTAQLWVKNLAPYSFGYTRPVLQSGLAASFSSFADMSQTLDCEHWPQEDQPAGVLYLCDVFDEKSSRTPQGEVRDWLSLHGPKLWAADRMEAQTFDNELLYNSTGKDNPLDAQYYQANVEPAVRYVLTLPGDTAYRMPAESSGYGNLYLAGDWTHTSVNGGSVEAAVESGMRAARAISGHPRELGG